MIAVATPERTKKGKGTGQSKGKEKKLGGGRDRSRGTTAYAAEADTKDGYAELAQSKNGDGRKKNQDKQASALAVLAPAGGAMPSGGKGGAKTKETTGLCWFSHSKYHNRAQGCKYTEDFLIIHRMANDESRIAPHPISDTWTWKGSLLFASW